MWYHMLQRIKALIIKFRVFSNALKFDRCLNSTALGHLLNFTHLTPYITHYIGYKHYGDVIRGMVVSQIIILTTVYSTVYWGADQRKHQSSTSLAFVWGIHRSPVNSPHKWPVTWKMFSFDDVIMSDLKMQYLHHMALILLLWIAHCCLVIQHSIVKLMSSLVQLMTCHQFGAKPLPEPMQTYWNEHLCKQTLLQNLNQCTMISCLTRTSADTVLTM